MQEEEKKEGDWEGFQQFPDPRQSLTKSQPPSKLHSKKESPVVHLTSPVEATPVRLKQRHNPRQKLLQEQSPKPSQTESLRSVVPKPSAEKAEEKERIAGERRQSVRTEKEERRSSVRYERIPIMRYEEDCRYAGRVVYKGFIPRTSDHYMRMLREVDWENFRERKRDIRNLHGIEFDSQFEGGNLNLAIEVSDSEYDLYLRVDSNTQGHRQWFFFSLKNQKPCAVRLNLYRFKKTYSLFQRGMRPYLRSRKDNQGWRPAGKDLRYRRQPSSSPGPQRDRQSFVLSFRLHLTHPNDEVFVASCLPYTFTHLQKQLVLYRQLSLSNEHLLFEIDTVGRSLCGLDILQVSVMPAVSKLLQTPKKFIVISARIHPGETSGSWVMDGILQEATSSPEVADWLLKENIELKLVPMVNPDGVVIGNYRTGILGQDLNRRFDASRPELYPEIAALKRVVSTCKRQGSLQLYLDLHGHSILKNSFIYGPSQNEISSFRMKNLAYHLFHHSKYFRLASCRFRNDSKTQTARLFFQHQEKVLSFTCENSLGLYYHHQTIQMQASDWQNFGKSVLHAMRDIYAHPEPQKSAFTSSFLPKSIGVAQNSPIKKGRGSVKVQVSQKPVQSQDQKQREKERQRQRQMQRQMKRRQKQRKRQQQRQKQRQQYRQEYRQQYRQEYRQKYRQEQRQKPEKRQKQRQAAEVYTEANVKREDELIQLGTSHPFKRKMIDGIASSTIATRQPSQATNPKQSRAFPAQPKKRRRQNEFTLERSISDSPSYVMNAINKLRAKEEPQMDEEEREELEAIREDFSQGYESINDADSSGDDLPEQDRNYIIDYLKMNQKKPEEPSEGRTPKNKSRSLRNPQISKFREIRFKSIEEVQEETDFQREFCRNQIKKLKLEPHKFKDSTAKSLLNKFQDSIDEHEFEDPGVVNISQQKKLVQRTTFCRRTQKEPFVLLYRKERLRRP